MNSQEEILSKPEEMIPFVSLFTAKILSDLSISRSEAQNGEGLSPIPLSKTPVPPPSPSIHQSPPPC